MNCELQNILDGILTYKKKMFFVVANQNYRVQLIEFDVLVFLSKQNPGFDKNMSSLLVSRGFLLPCK